MAQLMPEEFSLKQCWTMITFFYATNLLFLSHLFDWGDWKMRWLKRFSFFPFNFDWEGGKVERWKIIYLIKKKNKRIKNKVGINYKLTIKKKQCNTFFN